MCIPKEKDLKLKLNEKGEGKAYKFFLGKERLLPLCEDLADGKRVYYKTDCWIKSTAGPGFFMYRFKKDGESVNWDYTHVKRIRFRNISHQGLGFDKEPVIVAQEIFIPKEA